MKDAFVDRSPSKMKRKEDCRAIGVCRKVKNVRQLCGKGGSYSSRDIDVCVVSLILMLDKLIEKLDKS